MSETNGERNEALLKAHGVSPEYTEEQADAVGRVMLIALGAAGRISALEMRRFVEIATEYGATPGHIERWHRFNYADARIAEQAIEVTPRLARHMMYDAMRIVFAAAPRGPYPKLIAVARALGVQQAVVARLDVVLSGERALNRAHAALERSVKRRRRPIPPSVTETFAEMAEQEATLRGKRIAAMEEEDRFPR